MVRIPGLELRAYDVRFDFRAFRVQGEGLSRDLFQGFPSLLKCWCMVSGVIPKLQCLLGSRA